MLSYPEAYIDYLIYFHAERDYFECHEVMEQFWKDHPGDPLASTYVGLIQIAVSMYHQRRGNYKGAEKMLSQSLRNVTEQGMRQLGLDPILMRERLVGRLADLHNNAQPVYSDMDLPIADPELAARCLELSTERKLTWQCSSNLGDTYLIHKHTLRDRRSVIEERERSRDQKLRLRGMSHE